MEKIRDRTENYISMRLCSLAKVCLPLRNFVFTCKTFKMEIIKSTCPFMGSVGDPDHKKLCALLTIHFSLSTFD